MTRIDLQALALVVGLAWALAAPRAVVAQAGPRTLGVVIVPESGMNARPVLEIRPAFKKHLRLLDGVVYQDASVPLARGAESELNGQVNTAFVALNTGDFGGARKALAGMEERLLAAPASEDSVFLARFYKAYGCALVGNGLAQEGIARIKTSMFLFPRQSADEYGYGPAIAEAFNQARRELDELPSGGIGIATQPEGAEVYVDGAFAGISPVTVDRLAQGNHVVRAIGQGYEQAFAVLQVAAGSMVEEVVELRPAPFRDALVASLGVLPGADGPEAAAGPMRGLKQALGVDELAFVVLSEGPTAFSARGFYTNKDDKTFDVDDRVEKGAGFTDNVKSFVAFLTGAQVRDEVAIATLGRPVTVIEQGAGATAGAEAEAADELILDPNSPMFAEARKRQEKKSILTQWWFITGVVLLTAGAITGVYFLTQSSDATSSVPTGGIRVDIQSY